jgi:hypothetical protein
MISLISQKICRTRLCEMSLLWPNLKMMIMMCFMLLIFYGTVSCQMNSALEHASLFGSLVFASGHVSKWISKEM